MAHTQVIPQSSHSPGLAEVLERVLDKGVVIAGDIRIKLCDVELLTIQIRLLIASVDKARELGVNWWWQESPAHKAVPPPTARTRHSLWASPASRVAVQGSAGEPWQPICTFANWSVPAEAGDG